MSARSKKQAQKRAASQLVERVAVAEHAPANDRRGTSQGLMSVTSVTAKFHRGPLPAPEDLIVYNQAVPNGAERIMIMAEKQADHRRALEMIVIQADQKRAWAGLIIGGFVAVLGFACATVMALYDHPVVGGIFGGGVLISLVGTFVYGSQKKRSDKPKENLNQPTSGTPRSGSMR